MTVIFEASTLEGNGLVEVVGPDGYVGGAEGEDEFGFHVDDAVLILELAGDEQEFFAGDEQAVAFVEIGVDDDVGDASLVLHGKKDEAEGGAGALAGDDAAGGGDAAAVGGVEELFGAEDAGGVEVGAAKGHGVVVDGEACAGV